MSSPQFITTIDNPRQAATRMNFHNFITFPCLFAGDSVMIGPKWRHCRTWVYPPIRSLGWSAFPPAAGDRWRICCFGSGAIPVTPRGGNHQFQATCFFNYLKSKTHTSRCKTLQKKDLPCHTFSPPWAVKPCHFHHFLCHCPYHILPTLNQGKGSCYILLGVQGVRN